MIPLHLRPGAREWFFAWLEREHPALVPDYQRLYRRGSNASVEYRRRLADRVRPLVQAHGLHRPAGRGGPGEEGGDERAFPSGSLPRVNTGQLKGGTIDEQLTLL